MVIDQKYIRQATGLKVRSVRSCESTFDELKDNDVIIAQAQQKGEGRGSHKFFSPTGGLYIVMRERGLNIVPHTLTPAVGLAVRDSIKAVLGIDTRLKWVNDIMLSGKKVCGILVKSPMRGEYLIGIGINYATESAVLASAGLTDAGTLNASEMRATAFIVDLLKRVHAATLFPFQCERYNALCDTVGKNVSFIKGGVKVAGYAERVEHDGTLLVRIGMATVAVDSGEVSIVRETV